MTRRTYVALAKALADTNPKGMVDVPTIVVAYRLQWRCDCFAIANALHDDNPSFDVPRFLRDCGVSP